MFSPHVNMCTYMFVIVFNIRRSFYCFSRSSKIFLLLFCTCLVEVSDKSVGYECYRWSDNCGQWNLKKKIRSLLNRAFWFHLCILLLPSFRKCPLVVVRVNVGTNIMPIVTCFIYVGSEMENWISSQHECQIEHGQGFNWG